MILKQETVPEVDLLSEIPARMEYSRVIQNNFGLAYKGYLRNLNWHVDSDKLMIKGSLSKYHLGNNIECLTLEETKKAIHSICDEFRIPIYLGKIVRIDFGVVVPVKYKPTVYYKYFGDSRYYNRHLEHESLYYSNKSRRMIFYDKILESKKNKTKIPAGYSTFENLIRYEVRYSRSISKYLSEPDLSIYRLYNRDFYTKVLETLIKEFNSIHKVPQIQFNEELINTPKSLLDHLLAYYISQDGLDNVLCKIDELREMEVFPKKEYSSRCKQYIRRLLKCHSRSKMSDLYDEFCENFYKIIEDLR